MKKLVYLSLTFFIFSCGENEASSVEEGTDEVLSEEMIIDEIEEISESVEEEVTYVPVNEDGIWQIDDYVELYLKTKVYQSSDDIDYNFEGTYFYYTELDKRGGFANVTGAFEGWYEFVIWRMADGTDLLGVMSAGCGPVCDYSFTWFIGDNGKLEDVEFDKIFPADEINAHRDEMHQKIIDKHPDLDYPGDADLIYNFPKKGTSMEVVISIGAEEIQLPILQLSWDKKRFSVAEYYHEVK